MSRLRRVTGALIAVGMMLPTMVGAVSAHDSSLCEQADAAGAGAVVAGYKVVVGTGGSGHQIVLGYGGTFLSGGSGNDVLCAWGGGNTLDGGSGKNEIVQNAVPTPEIIGTWTGTVAQLDSQTYPLTVTITGGSPGTIVGTYAYPTLGCGGNLLLVASEPGRLTVTEQLTYNGSCVDLGMVTLDLQSDGSLVYAWFYSGTSTAEASGTLYPVP